MMKPFFTKSTTVKRRTIPIHKAYLNYYNRFLFWNLLNQRCIVAAKDFGSLQEELINMGYRSVGYHIWTKASDPPNNWIQVSEDLATEISIAAMKEAGILLD